MDQLTEVAREIQRQLRTLGPGKVLALWPDGSFTVERPPASRGTPGRSASEPAPVTTFAPAWAELTVDELAKQLRDASAKLDR